jgi:hypothetical protein
VLAVIIDEVIINWRLLRLGRYIAVIISLAVPAAGHMRISPYFMNYDEVIESLIQALGTLETLAMHWQYPAACPTRSALMMSIFLIPHL